MDTVTTTVITVVGGLSVATVESSVLASVLVEKIVSMSVVTTKGIVLSSDSLLPVCLV